MTKNNKNILVTGCAGFIGFHTCLALLKNKHFNVFGIDNLNKYYDKQLKLDRLKILKNNKSFVFNKINISNKKKVDENFRKNKYDYVVHLAAQAGVRYSIESPETYVKSNQIGFFNIFPLMSQNACSRPAKIQLTTFASIFKLIFFLILLKSIKLTFCPSIKGNKYFLNKFDIK